MKRDYPLSKDEFREVYSKVPKVAVQVVIKVGDGVVLNRRTSDGWEGLWEIPGATLYMDESVEDCAIRVAREELGIEVKIEEFLGYSEMWSEKKQRGFGYTVTLDFLCTTGDDLPEKNFDGGEVKVFEEAPEEIVEEHGELLEKVFVAVKSDKKL